MMERLIACQRTFSRLSFSVKSKYLYYNQMKTDTLCTYYQLQYLTTQIQDTTFASHYYPAYHARMASKCSKAVIVFRQFVRCRNSAMVKNGSFQQRNFSSETSSKKKANVVPGNARVDTHLFPKYSANIVGGFQKAITPSLDGNAASALIHPSPNHSTTARTLNQSELLQPFISDNQWRYKYSRFLSAGEKFEINLRSFSTKTGEQSEKKELTSGNDKVKTEEEQVDKEFAEYLTGKMDDGVPSISASTSLMEELKSDLSKSESAKKLNRTDSYQESSSKTQETNNQSQSTDEWFNSLLSNSTDLGRPTPEVNEQYRSIERKNLVNIEKSRERQITTVRRALGGNLIIAVSKLAAFLHSGSSAILSEFIHSVVDCGNQSLLLIGLRDAGNEADRTHPYGYGKSIYFWALVSALGTFFLGAGVSMTQALPQLLYGGSLHEITWHVWGVLGFSFAVDGYVFTKTLSEVNAEKPDNVTLW